MLLFMAFLFSPGLFAQTPCDLEVDDSLLFNMGPDNRDPDLTFIQAMPGTNTGDKLHNSSFSMTLNKGVLYRFTSTNSKFSEVDYTIGLYHKSDGNRELIKQHRLSPGTIKNFEYDCELSGDYSLKVSPDKAGRGCQMTILSKVNRK